MTSISIGEITDSLELRRGIDEEAMQELMASISERGLVVPIAVRHGEGGYQLVYGSRRLEACKRLSLTEVECVIVDVDDTETILWALTENIQRKELSDMEEGEAFKTLKEQTGWSDEKIGKSVGKGQTYISQRLALTQTNMVNKAFHVARHEVPDAAKKALFVRQLQQSSPSLVKSVAEKVVEEGLTSRQTEFLVGEVKKAIDIGGLPLAKTLINMPYEGIAEGISEANWDKPVKKSRKLATQEERARTSFLKGEEFANSSLEFKAISLHIKFVEEHFAKNPGNAVATLLYFKGMLLDLVKRIDVILKEVDDAGENWPTAQEP